MWATNPKRGRKRGEYLASLQKIILWNIWPGCAQASYSTLPFLNIPPNKALADSEAFNKYEDIHKNESNSQDTGGSN